MSPIDHLSPLKMRSKVSSGTSLLYSGGNSRAIRCICVISAAVAEPSADIKLPFGGFSPASRRQFSGNNANNAVNATIIASFTTF